MRRNFTAFMPVLIMGVVAIICVIAYMGFTGKLPKISGENQVANVQSENEIILAKNELPRLDAAVNLQPLMTAVARNFTQDGSVSNGTFNYSDTNEAYKKLINGEADIIFAPYPIDDIITMAGARGIELEIVPIVKEALVFMTNYDNPINSLNVSDIQKIYTGQVKNWSELDGENIDIKPFQRTVNSPTQNAMVSLVMKDLQMIEPDRKSFYDKTFGEINDLTSNYDNSKNAIGYAFYYDSKVMYNFDERIDNAVKLLKVNDIEPNYENVHNGSYPIQTSYYLVKNKDNNYENVKIFVDAVLSDRGKKVVREAGYIDN